MKLRCHANLLSVNPAVHIRIVVKLEGVDVRDLINLNTNTQKSKFKEYESVDEKWQCICNRLGSVRAPCEEFHGGPVTVCE